MGKYSEIEIEERIVNLESRIAFMQVTLDELNAVVAKQHDLLDDLQKRFQELENAAKEALVEKDQSTKPPHY